MKPPRASRPRNRVLFDDELRAIWEHTDQYPFGTIVRLLILTGQRRTEISSLRWEWIDGDTITLPEQATKNGRAHTFPIGQYTQAIIANIPRLDDCPYLFPASRQMSTNTTTFNGWGKPMDTLREASNTEGWSLHDLRRTYSTTMAQIGVSQLITERLLNHVSGGTQSPIARVYNVYDYLPEMREAVAQYEAHVLKLVAPIGS